MKKEVFKIFLAVLLAGFLTAAAVWAWTEPSQAPPNANAPAPINVSGTSQTKAGNLTVSELYAANFRAAPGVPTTRLMGNTGSGRIEVWDRLSVSASHNFGNFPDPQSGGIIAAGDIIATASPGTFTSGGSYISISARGSNLPGYPGQTYPVLKTDSPYIYFATGGPNGPQYAAYLGNGNNYTNSTFGVGNVYAYANVYGPIFYDINNTGYYLNPDGYSQTYVLYRTYGFNGPEYDINNSGYYLDPNGTSRMNTVNADYVYRTYGYNGREYDLNNSGYYVDPDQTSRLGGLSVNNIFSYGSISTDVYQSMYAWDYYIRAAGKWASQLSGGRMTTYVGSCSVGASGNSYQDCSPASIGTWGNFMYARDFHFAGDAYASSICEVLNQGMSSVFGRARHGGGGSNSCTFDIWR